MNFIEKVLSKNREFTYFTLQLLVIYAVSVIVCCMIKHYVKGKTGYGKYGVYGNFVMHYKEYIVTNFFALYPFIGLYIAIQFESLCKMGWSVGREEDFVNLMVTSSVLLVAMLLPFLTLSMFPPKP